jgi:hypothetical protein
MIFLWNIINARSDVLLMSLFETFLSSIIYLLPFLTEFIAFQFDHWAILIQFYL